MRLRTRYVATNVLMLLLAAPGASSGLEDYFGRGVRQAAAELLGLAGRGRRGT